MLNYHEFGEKGGGPSVVIAHGLFGSSRNWRAIAKHISARHHVVVVDMRNHGSSFWDNDHSYRALAADLAGVIDSIGGPATVLGHSMGGKAAMMLAFMHPELIEQLIVVDIAPVSYPHSHAENIEIMQSLPLDHFTKRSEADQWLANSVDDAATRAFFLQSLVISEQGNSWTLNLVDLAANMDQIIGFPEVSNVFDRPAHFIRGALSYYAMPPYEASIERHFPKAEIHTIQKAGHWVHAEATRKFIETLDQILA